jgi:hypothetical protein
MFNTLRNWFRSWSWYAGAPIMTAFIVGIAALAVVQPTSVIDAIRYTAIAFLLVLLGLFLSIMVSNEQVQRDRSQAEMITGGDNFCFLTVERHDLANAINFLRLWIRSTGPLLDVTYHISPADSRSGHGDERYFFLDKLREQNPNVGPSGGGFAILQKGSRTIGNVLDAATIRQWRVQFTARNGRWTQWIDLTRLDKGFRDTTKVEHNDGRILWPPEAAPQGW